MYRDYGNTRSVCRRGIFCRIPRHSGKTKKMKIKFFPAERDPKKALAIIAKSNGLSKENTKKIFKWVFTQNKNPDPSQLQRLVAAFNL